MRTVCVALASLLGLAIPSVAAATTEITSGTYGGDSDVSVSGSVSPTGTGGAVLFTLTLSGPADWLVGDVLSDTNYVDYCDMDGSGIAVVCGSDGTITDVTLDPVAPNVYQARVPVGGPSTVHYGGVDRTDYFYSCCTFSFDFQPQAAGSYVFSYTTVPEPAAWMMMIVGFGMLGGSIRRRRLRLPLVSSPC